MTNLTLYKFRSTTRLDLLADILVSERLYCAKVHELNDPMEGYFSMSMTLKGEGRFSTKLTIPQNILDRTHDTIRVCSLASEITDVRMWAHYGGAHTGVAIEMDLTNMREHVTKVTYTRDLLPADVTHEQMPDYRTVLSRKTPHWDYESEYRFITTDEYLPVSGMIRRVIVGRSCPEAMIAILRRLLPSGCGLGRVKLDPSTYLLNAYDIK